MEKRDPRVERLAGKVPGWYSPFRHFFITIGLLAVTSILLLVFRPEGPIPTRAWVLAAVVFWMGNLSEYLLHRYPMHRRWRRLKSFFQSHTIVHHRFFTRKQMEMEQTRDLFFILPSYSVIVFSFTLLALTYGATLLIFGPVEAAVTASSLAFYGVYSELIHVSFHLPEKWMSYPILRSKPFQWMKRHHRLHHDPKVMRKWNFNIGIPLFDVLFGTLAPAEEIRDADKV
jgi:hypothetical protein